MKFGVHKGTWGDSFSPDHLETFFRQAKEIGAETVEFRPTDAMMEYDLQEIRKIKKLAEEYDVELLFTFGYPKELNLLSEDPYVRNYAVDYLLRGVRSVAAAGSHEMGSAGLYAVWPTRFDNDLVTPENREERIERSVQCMKRVMPVAEDLGVQMNMEVINRFETYVMNTVEQGLEYCDRVGSPNCGLLLDCFHMNIEEEDIPKAIVRAGKRLGHFHVSETNRGLPLPGGRTDWKQIAGALKEAGYNKTVTIESVVTFESASTYNMRMWRNLLEDVSLENRLSKLGESLQYLRSCFQGE